MRPTLFATALVLGTCINAFSQISSTPDTLRLVTPKGPGSITIHMAGWTIKSFKLYDNDTRAVLLLKNDVTDLLASYILSNDETFDYNKESCKNDVLGPLVKDMLTDSTLKYKRNDSRALPSGQTLDIGSFLIAKSKGVTLNQQNVFGFIGHDHTCSEIHLSRTPFKQGDEHLFAPALDSFQFDPAYIPQPTDYKAMSSLLPPGVPSAYQQAPATKPRMTAVGKE